MKIYECIYGVSYDPKFMCGDSIFKTVSYRINCTIFNDKSMHQDTFTQFYNH